MNDGDITEDTILLHLLDNQTFLQQVGCYIQPTYFTIKENKIIFETLTDYYREKNYKPEIPIILIEISEKVNDKIYENIKNKIEQSFVRIQDLNWLIKKTETWCRDRALYLSITKAIDIYSGNDETLTRQSIPDLITQSLAINFNTTIGFDWYLDANDRFDRYKNEENKLTFKLPILNAITNGGISRKTLNLIYGGIHVGKTMTLVHLACDYARHGYNVLYITMEMSEDEILLRMDANLLNIPTLKIQEMQKNDYLSRINNLKTNYGDIKVIQYATSAAHSGHFKTAINELKLKKRWIPDIVIVDYIGIVASAKLKAGTTNSHFYLKSVAEELRALAIEYNVAVWSAMQLTRTGMQDSDVEITDIAESIGIPGVCDLIIALTRNDILDASKHVAIKQLKNRYRNLGFKQRFEIGVDMETQSLFDISNDDDYQILKKISNTTTNKNDEIDYD